MTATITVDRTSVFEQVERTTGYAGAKLVDKDEKAYERISTTRADEALLMRFWHESRHCVCHALRRLIEAEGMEGSDTYRIDLNLSEAFDEALLPSLAGDLEAWFVNAVTDRWMNIVDKEKASDYMAAASEILAELQRKVLCKRPPRRPRY